jgi:acetyltransferase
MSLRNLEFLLRPRSVAILGASSNPASVGTVVMRNVMQGGFKGAVMPVNPKYDSVGGLPNYRDVASLPLAPDLAVLCTPPATIPPLIAELGKCGTRAAVVLTAGLSQLRSGTGADLQQAMLAEARPHLLRILGPNCLGLIVPPLGLNASFAHASIASGRLAFVAQSGAMCTAVLDWARSSGIGFSHFISLGNSADVDFGDLLDYLGSDPGTSAILLYIESISRSRKFMSAARAAARNKPVLAVKAGRVAEGARAAASHTGALAGVDDVYDAALRRAGIFRVFDTEELFDAVETLARARPPCGERLAILSNGGGPGVMATDALVAGGGRLADLSAATLSRLEEILPPTWSRANPIDIVGDASAGRYEASARILLDDPGVDALLALYAPTAMVSGVEVARAVADAARGAERGILASWLGRDGVAEGRRVLRDAGIPTYDSPEDAARAFLHLIRFRRNQEMLTATPPSIPDQFNPDLDAARRLIGAALSEGREWLTEPEAKQLLTAYGVPVVPTRIARNAAEAADLAAGIGFPVALKILSPDVTHKSDVGGVVLDLETSQAVAAAAEAMAARLSRLRPQARLTGFSVQAMARRGGARELIAGAATDPTFGPVILFGHGGTAVEVIADRAVGLPPLDMNLAHELVSRTRVSRLLEGYRDRRPADREAVCLTLIKVSQLIVDLPQVTELDVNPLLADEGGVLALDARVRVAAAGGISERLAIRPYPKELEESILLRTGQRVFLRPIRPEDEPAHHAFHSRLEPEDIRFRFFGMVRSLPHSQMARLTQIDYDREMAFIATPADGGARTETLGVVRTASDPDNHCAEFSIIVRSDLKGHGLGHALLEKMIRYCRERGTGEMIGQVLLDNTAMLDLARSLGFTIRPLPEDGVLETRLKLQSRD